MIIDSMLDFGTVELKPSTTKFEFDIDAGAAGDAIGHEIYLVVTSGEVTGTGTLDVVAVTSSAVTTADEPTWTDKKELVSKKLSEVKAHKILMSLPLPRVCGRFLRVETTITGFSGGELSAFLTNGPQMQD